MRKNIAKPNQILVLRSIHFASHELNGVNEVRQKRENMTRNQKMAMGEIRIQQICKDLEKEIPNLKLVGVTDEEIKIRVKVHALMWLGALEQKPGKYKEADDFIRSIILCNAAMLEMGIIDEHAELINKH